MGKIQANSRSLCLSASGLVAAHRAFACLGMTREHFVLRLTQEYGRTITRQPLGRFLQGKPIDRENFHLFCQKLGLDRDEAVNIEIENDLLDRQTQDGLPKWLTAMRFTAFLMEKRRDFVGRSWLLELISDWVERTTRPGIALVVGDPGAGKSAIAAQMILEPHCLAYHCCQADTEESLSPGRFVHSLASMIAQKFAPFRENLDDAAVEEVLRLPAAIAQPGTAFEVGILDVLAKVEPPSDQKFIVIDGLDEGLRRASGHSIIDVIAERIHRLPSWLRIVATTRPEPAVLSSFSGVKSFTIRSDDPLNRHDICLFLEQRLTQLREPDQEQIPLKNLILERADGNFLWASQAVACLEAGAESELLTQMPPGLGTFYYRFFERQFQGDFNLPRRLLEVVLASEKPLNEEQLATAAQIDRDDELPMLLRKLAVYLPARCGEDGGEYYSLFHNSLRDWLSGSGSRGTPYQCQVRRGHRLLAELFRKATSYKRLWKDYLKQYGSLHLVEAEEFDMLSQQLQSNPDLFIANTAETLSNLLADKDPCRVEKAELAIEHLLCENTSSPEHFQVIVETAFCLTDYRLQNQALKIVQASRKHYGDYLELALTLKQEAEKNSIDQVIILARRIIEQSPPVEALVGFAHFHLAEGLRIRGEHLEALKAYRKAVLAIKPKVHLRIWIDAQCALADLEYVRGHLSEAMTRLEHLAEETVSAGVPTVYCARICRIRGQIHHLCQQWSLARKDHEESLRLFRQMRKPIGIIESLNSLAQVLIVLEPNVVLQMMEQARTLALEHHTPLEYGKTYSVEAEWHLSQNDPAQALAIARRSEELLQQVGYGSGVARARTLAAQALIRLGQLEAALETGLTAHRYYRNEEIYPLLRLETYRLVTEAARLLGVQSEYANIDVPEAIPGINQLASH
jgi:tetratricopeptide (TPR) repeat protein